jgi:hypothetical protein
MMTRIGQIKGEQTEQMIVGAQPARAPSTLTIPADSEGEVLAITTYSV